MSNIPSMEMTALKKMTPSDLHLLLNEQKEELRKMRFKAGQRQLKDIRKIRVTKIAIAQILGILSN